VRAVIITGMGRGFCSGMNVAAEAGGSGILRAQATVSTGTACATVTDPAR
jgi:enoyl-CoA hydratase/carnithine racemase